MAKTVLIVEDNEMNMKLFDDLLQAHNYSTLNAINCAQARKQSLAHDIDAILMDIDLPDGDGLTLTQEIKQVPKLKNIPIIALTAFAMKGDKERMLAHGCDGYLAKPINIHHFMDTLQNALNKA